MAINTNNKEELPEKWKVSFIVHINWNDYKGFCNEFYIHGTVNHYI